MVRNKKFSMEKCKWRHGASECSHVSCTQVCNMPCPFDVKRHPCEMCEVEECVKEYDEDCEAVKFYGTNPFT